MFVSESMYELGSKRSAIRELFEYGKKRAAIVGAENVYISVLEIRQFRHLTVLIRQ